jgi:hypothetical protein
MIHWPKLPTLTVPIDITLYDVVTPRTGEASHISVKFLCLDNGLLYDFAVGNFSASPGTPTTGVTAVSNRYYVMQDVGPWPRGNYRAIFVHNTSGEVWNCEFTVGMKADRRLGYSAVYNGTALTLTVWVEEDGVAASDFSTLDSPQLLDSNGVNYVSGWTTNGPTNGVFYFQQTVDLPQTTNYVFCCTAVVPGPSGTPNYEYPLKVGIARP